MDGVGGELWLIDRDLSTSYKVLDGPLDDVSQLHWAPDSASLAVVIGRSHVQEHYSFRIIRIASFQGRSTDAVFLPELCSEVSLVQWCPEGRYLLAVISYDPREYEDDENAAHMRLLMADLAPSLAVHYFQQIETLGIQALALTPRQITSEPNSPSATPTQETTSPQPISTNNSADPHLDYFKMASRSVMAFFMACALLVVCLFGAVSADTPINIPNFSCPSNKTEKYPYVNHPFEYISCKGGKSYLKFCPENEEFKGGKCTSTSG
ncbi:hypothetical protein WJX84_001113 [Apatococcus fuscideae]|uniref:Vitellogenin n=1 Tax=Apatococcus fuscideae TaxID=2026836 RepID=A0AAW1TDY2_9CHLO